MKVMVVDDIEQNLYLLEVLLRSEKYEVVCARDGLEALEHLRKGSFSLIISDILMPRMDGFQLCRECKVDPHLKDIPFIFYTATYTDGKDEEFALSLGADRFMVKPMEPQIFLAAIREVIQEYEKGSPLKKESLIKDEELYLVEYNKRLIQKLEKKMLDLEMTHRTLAESEMKYRSLFDNSIDAVLLTSPEGSILKANAEASRIFGYTEEELCQIGRYGVVDPSDPRLPKALEERNRTGKFRGELTFIRKDRTTFPGEISSSIFKDKDGAVRTSMIIRDITERKRAEEALKALYSRQEALLAALPDIVMEVDVNKVYTWANRPGFDFFGKDVIGKEADFYFEGEQGTYEVVQPLFNGSEGVIYLESWQRRRDGEKRLLAWWCRVLKDEQGNVTGALSSARDITERKRAEEALRSEREKLEMVTRNIGAGLALISKDYQTLWANNVLKQIFGDVEGKPCYSTYNQGREICPGCGVREVFEKGSEKVVHEEVGKDIEGNTIWSEIIATPVKDEDGNITAALELVIPITDRKRAEEALRESEKKYRTLVTQSPDGIFIVDLQGTFLAVNKSMCERLKYSEEEFLSMKIWDIVPEKYVDLHKKRLADILRGEAPNEAAEYVVRGKDENTHYIEILSNPYFRENEVIGFQGIARDITERKRAEEALSESERRYRLLAENLTDIIWTSDLNLRLTYVSPSVKRIRGYSVEEALTQTLEEILTPASFEVARKVLTEEMEIENVERKDLFRVRTIELEENCKSGSTVWTESTITFLRDSEGRALGILGVTRDISDRKKAEQEMIVLQEQLLQSQKMEAIGQLAGGIAHDFNNLLTVIQGYSQLSLLDLEERDPLRANIEEIQEAAKKAADLTRHLLAFSRKQILEMRVLDLNQVFQRLDKMLRRIIGEDVELVSFLSEDLGKVKVDPGQVEQVIMNLSVNARDAMPKGGKLTIETANVELDKEYAHKHIAVQPGRYVVLSMSDTGVGMPPEVKERIFEPFFTTKEKGKGTGLGLSTVYGIVKQSGGNIWVYSELGQGTTFKIYLPRVDEPLEEITDEVIKEILHGNETILVVEDEEVVRKLAVRLLKKQGYKVLDAPDGGKALMLCEEFKEPIHLILTDVVMPGMSGRKLVDRLKEIHPEMKTLFMSGYTDNAILRHGVLEEGVNFIQKPFSVERLARKVRDVLDK